MSKPAVTSTNQPSDWAVSELEAAVASYMAMLRHELEGKFYVKAEYNRRLRTGELASRSKSSVEKRMQNISAIMQELKLPMIAGYQPYGNVGSNVKPILIAAIEKLSSDMPWGATFNSTTLDARVEILLKQPMIDAPSGNPTPKKSNGVTTVFERSPAIKAWVLKNAGPYCEACYSTAPFETAPGRPYLEVHHVIPLADGGPDVIENAVALCPNCHRRCHHSFARVDFIREIYLKVPRLLPRPEEEDTTSIFI